MRAEVFFDNRSGRDVSETMLENIRKAAVTALECEKYDEDCEISISIVSQEEIRELNAAYRNIDRVTDVLSFPMDDEPFEGEAAVLGDVVLCYDRAEEQAEEYGHGINREICYLTVHSVLHLLGYDHMNDEEKREMRQHEEAAMEKLNLTRR